MRWSSAAAVLFSLPLIALADNWPRLAWSRQPGDLERDVVAPPLGQEDQHPLEGRRARERRQPAGRLGRSRVLTGSDGRLNDRLHVYCYHRDDGRLLWHSRLFGSAPTDLFAAGGMAVPTPVTDGTTPVRSVRHRRPGGARLRRQAGLGTLPGRGIRSVPQSLGHGRHRRSWSVTCWWCRSITGASRTCWEWTRR